MVLQNLSIIKIILKNNEIFGLYWQIDLYRTDFIYILVTQVDSRFEIAKTFSKDSLNISLEYTEVRNFRFFPLGKTKKWCMIVLLQVLIYSKSYGPETFLAM